MHLVRRYRTYPSPARKFNGLGRAQPSRLARYIVCCRIFLRQYLYFSLFFTHGSAMTCANNCNPCTCTCINPCTCTCMDCMDLAKTTSLRRRRCHLRKPVLQSMLDVCMLLGCMRTVCAALYTIRQGTKSQFHRRSVLNWTIKLNVALQSSHP